MEKQFSKVPHYLATNELLTGLLSPKIICFGAQCLNQIVLEIRNFNNILSCIRRSY